LQTLRARLPGDGGDKADVVVVVGDSDHVIDRGAIVEEAQHHSDNIVGVFKESFKLHCDADHRVNDDVDDAREKAGGDDESCEGRRPAEARGRPR